MTPPTLTIIMLATAAMIGGTSATNSSGQTEVDSMFRTADSNHDGHVSKKEWDSYMLLHLKEEQSHTLIELHRGPHDNEDHIPPQYRATVANVEERASQFWNAFLNSVAMVVVTELGDKTFFIAAILAMTHSQLAVFIGSASALYAMTVLSASIGFALPNLLPREYTHVMCMLLFLYFGVKLLWEARGLYAAGEGAGASDELAEVEEEMHKADKQDGDDKTDKASSSWLPAAQNAIVIQAFFMTFTAEWGDRSQIATIALAAAKDPVGVTLGGVVGHSFCTGLAVIGGKLLASRISERAVLFAGGILFLVFAVHSYLTPDI